MTVKFSKYQGTGNDFVMIDNRELLLKPDSSKIEKICHRKWGVGADGLIFLQMKPGYDFEMVYFNSDGRESSMCGNGGRCLIQFAKQLKVISNRCKFWAIDGEHEGEILPDGQVSLRMKDVHTIEVLPNKDVLLNTGSPHYVLFDSNTREKDIVSEAKQIRYSKAFANEGVNVNFVQKINSEQIFVRTYERGVEDETLSCGTGVVAATLATAYLQPSDTICMDIQTPGGTLQVSFLKSDEGFKNIYLTGPAQHVFEGTVEI